MNRTPFKDFDEILDAIYADYTNPANDLVLKLAATVPQSLVSLALGRAEKVVKFNDRCHGETYFEALEDMHRQAQIEVGIISKEMKLTYGQLLALRAAVEIQVAEGY